MRDIKFRAWDKDDQTLRQVRSIHNIHSQVNVHADLCMDGFPAVEERRNIILMQYTGLKDRNGVEIYEGDILEAERNSHVEDVFDPGIALVVIVWDQGDVQFIANDMFEYLDGNRDEPTHMTNGVWVYMKVIGNIYENPELLKDGDV